MILTLLLILALLHLFGPLLAVLMDLLAGRIRPRPRDLALLYAGYAYRGVALNLGMLLGLSLGLVIALVGLLALAGLLASLIGLVLYGLEQGLGLDLPGNFQGGARQAWFLFGVLVVSLVLIWVPALAQQWRLLERWLDFIGDQLRRPMQLLEDAVSEDKGQDSRGQG